MRYYKQNNDKTRVTDWGLSTPQDVVFPDRVKTVRYVPESAKPQVVEPIQVAKPISVTPQVVEPIQVAKPISVTVKTAPDELQSKLADFLKIVEGFRSKRQKHLDEIKRHQQCIADIDEQLKPFGLSSDSPYVVKKRRKQRAG